MREIIENAVNLTRELIAVPSESSEPTATTGPCEAGIVEVLKRLCAMNDITWQLQEVLPERFNFIASFPKPGAPRIVFLAHMDTVSAQGMRNPFLAEVRDNKIWGRGACDDKGPLAALFSTLIGLHGRGIPLGYDVTLVGSVDEECGMAGSDRLARDNPNGWDLCVALEPSRLQPISTHIGVYRCRILPQRGSGAESLMAIKEELGRLKAAINRQSHPALGKAVMTITLIAADKNRKTGMETDRILVDIRLLPDHQPAKIHAYIQQVVGDRGRVIPLFAAFGLDSDPHDQFIQAFQASIRARNFPDKLIGVPFPSDCSRLKNRGTCLVWGPGDYKAAHKPHEFIEIEQLAGACRVLSHFLARGPGRRILK
ncbi:MAG TPA: M20 family peptidase [Desulfobacterales bacterium]|nr:M20 family peptidase [Desulfobacterales bacterium]